MSARWVIGDSLDEIAPEMIRMMGGSEADVAEHADGLARQMAEVEAVRRMSDEPWQCACGEWTTETHWRHGADGVLFHAGPDAPPSDECLIPRDFAEVEP